MEGLDNILGGVYFVLLGFFIGRLRANKRVMIIVTALLSTSRAVFMYIFHKHQWGERERPIRHVWDHAEIEYRACKTCFVKEYFLIYLFCPTKKRTGKYCYGCSKVGEEWDKAIDKKEHFQYTPDMEKLEKSKKVGRPRLLSRNIALAIEHKMYPQTLLELGSKYGITNKSKVHHAIKSGSRFVNWEEVEKTLK